MRELNKLPPRSRFAIGSGFHRICAPYYTLYYRNRSLKAVHNPQKHLLVLGKEPFCYVVYAIGDEESGGHIDRIMQVASRTTIPKKTEAMIQK